MTRSENMLDRLRTKIASGRRLDLYLADFRALSNTDAILLLGYDSSEKPPGLADIQTAVVSMFDGKLQPSLETARQYTDHNAIRVIAHITTETRPIFDADRMVSIASTMFIDQEMGAQWEAITADDGTKYLARVVDENIVDVLKERRKRMAIQASTLVFGSAIRPGLADLQEGDEVKFYDKSQIKTGIITGENVGKYTIKTANGNFEVTPEAVLDVINPSPNRAKSEQERLREYYRQAYGDPDFASNLTRDAMES